MGAEAFLGDVAEMRRQHEVVELAEGMIDRQRLDREHVDRGADARTCRCCRRYARNPADRRAPAARAGDGALGYVFERSGYRFARKMRVENVTLGTDIIEKARPIGGVSGRLGPSAWFQASRRGGSSPLVQA